MEARGAGDAPDGRTKTLRDRPFALRLQEACDENPYVPAYNYGRQAWVKTQLQQRFKVSVSNETVSKWFTGVARPRPDKINLLAKLLEVDEAWLALGVAPELTPRDRKIRNAIADGAVNVVAGFIQMTGGHPAFPDDSDNRSKGGPRIDLYAIIKGSHYSFHVALAQGVGAGVYKFAVPYGHEERVVIGVVQRKPLICDFLELTPSLIETHGVRRSGYIELTVVSGDDRYVTGEDSWPKIDTFGEHF
jgi:transcriptional regulator with XRE-family HTH domain